MRTFLKLALKCFPGADSAVHRQSSQNHFQSWPKGQQIIQILRKKARKLLHNYRTNIPSKIRWNLCSTVPNLPKNCPTCRRNQILHLSCQDNKNHDKIVPGPSKMEARGLPNRARKRPRRYFWRASNLRGSKGAAAEVFWGQNVQLGAKLEAQEPPKSRPKAEKIDVKKQHDFGIDFGRFRTSFWRGFR